MGQSIRSRNRMRLSGAVCGAPATITAIEAASALVPAVVVIGLMSAAGDALRETPVTFLAALGSAFVLNFALQALALIATCERSEPRALAVVAGNRNVALFLRVLPACVPDNLLLLIGCYQIAMYLIPLILPRVPAAGRR